MSKIIKKILDFFKSLFGKSQKPEVSQENTINEEIVEEKPTTNEPENKPSEKSKDDPTFSDPFGTVDTFLWKPKSDHDDNVVVVVSCDEIKSTDLKIEIFDSNNNKLNINYHANTHWNKRGNGLPGFKYERIHFKPGKTANTFNKKSPIYVKFYAIIDGKRYDIKVMGKESMKIKDASKRIDLR